MQWDGDDMETGVYGYMLQVTIEYWNGSHPSDTHRGEIAIVNRKGSSYGPGWWVAGLEQLISTNGRWLWVGGDGSTRVYSWTAPGVWVAPGRVFPTNPR